MTQARLKEDETDKRKQACIEAARRGRIEYKVTLFDNPNADRNEGIRQANIEDALESLGNYSKGVLLFEGQWQAGGHIGDLCDQIFYKQSLPNDEIKLQKEVIDNELTAIVAQFVFNAGGPKR